MQVRQITTALLGILLFIFGFNTYADTQKLYLVELVIYSNITPKALSSEKWPLIKPGDFTRSGIRQLTPSIAAINPNASFVLMPQNKLLLNRLVQSINGQPNYKVLMHIAWLQPMKRAYYTKPIHIYGGNLYSSSGQVLAFDRYGSMSYKQQGNWQVNGTIKVSMERYFDLKLNLQLSEPAAQLAQVANNDYFSDMGNGLVRFRLLQTRRMRSDELNYIDFPLYGMLIEVTPLDHIKANL